MRNLRGGYKSQLKPLGGTVGAVLDELGFALDSDSPGTKLMRGWPGVVGEECARFCEPRGIRNGVLEVEVSTPAWGMELQLRQNELLEKLRALLGADAPRRLRFLAAAPRCGRPPLASGGGAR